MEMVCSKKVYLVKTKVEDNEFSIPLLVFRISYSFEKATAFNFTSAGRISESTDERVAQVPNVRNEH